ncbi:MAG: hypothetical protein OEY09_18030 [Gammaproteobacteria bacterium]|nr:hypothetical protein [Gammaproteobacteria bacterium]
MQSETYQTSISTLNSTHSRYKKLVKDLDLFDQYRSLYDTYQTNGLLGGERRLSWIESLQVTNEVLRLPSLTYNLLPQENFSRPGLKVLQGVALNSSPMELSMGMLHEEDLFALLEGLRLSIQNLFTVDSCSLTRNSPVDVSLDTKKANMQSKCLIRWVTINAR